jgi:hypothetical protein
MRQPRRRNIFEICDLSYLSERWTQAPLTPMVSHVTVAYHTPRKIFAPFTAGPDHSIVIAGGRIAKDSSREPTKEG